MENFGIKDICYAIISKTHTGTVSTFPEVLAIAGNPKNKFGTMYKKFYSESDAYDWIVECQTAKGSITTFKPFKPKVVSSKKKRKIEKEVKVLHPADVDDDSN